MWGESGVGGEFGGNDKWEAMSRLESMEATDVGIRAMGEVNRGRGLAILGGDGKKKFEIDALHAPGRHGSVLLGPILCRAS